MKPINFPQATKVLQRPSTMAESECQSLHVWNDGKQCVSCWKPSIKERLNILFGGKVWLGVLSGKTQPPVFVAGERVFTKTPFMSHVRAFIQGMKEDVTEALESLKKGFKSPDKRKHFIIGFLITLLVGALVNQWIGLGITIIAGFIKERWDSKGHGTVEAWDIIFTALGGLCAFPLAWFFNFLIW